MVRTLCFHCRGVQVWSLLRELRALCGGLKKKDQISISRADHLSSYNWLRRMETMQQLKTFITFAWKNSRTRVNLHSQKNRSSTILIKPGYEAMVPDPQANISLGKKIKISMASWARNKHSVSLWVHMFMLSRVWPCATLWTVACQAPLSMGIIQAGTLKGVVYPLGRQILLSTKFS